FGGRGERLERERADAHAGIERHGQNTDVAELERRVADPARIEHARRAVHDDPEAAEAAAAFEAGEEIPRQLQRLDRHAEHELPGMQREGLIGSDLDLAHDLVDVDAFAEVDVREAAMLEHAELRAEPEVDGAAAELRLEVDGRRDANLARVDVLAD